MRVLVASAALAAWVLAAPAFAAPHPALVRGELVSGRQRLVLTHGAALLHDGAEGFDAGGPRLRLLLSEAPVDPALLQGVLPQLRLQELSRGGALRAVLVEVDPAAPEQVQISPLLSPVNGAGAVMASLSLYSSGGPGPGAFETFSFQARRLRAALTYSRESSAPPDADDIRSLVFQVDLPVQPEPAVTARVEGGDAVRATPQGRLALERARTVASLDAAGLARLRAQDPAAVAPLPAEIPEAQLLELLRGLAADQLRGLSGTGLLLVERGDRAVLVIHAGEGLRSWIRFHRRDGVWTLGEPPVP
ncbi:hypothetical protein [Cyanobium sp. CH-040]|uniref:hypothetical protein n=1 Tax=Cyanobium sp. CH-040 TaxID=2823708 RepID=UPI0020CEA86E|nr:hypothetical protein [Cyanobium sp. CH-040]MCP9927616.1 hypothetical protein [Cyanobium sp. CH-040]